MKPKTIFVITGTILIAIIAIILVKSYENYNEETNELINNPNSSNLKKTNNNDQNLGNSLISKKPDVKLKIELVADNLFVPWSIIFTSKDRILFTERNGRIREIKNGVLNPNPLKIFQDISALSEEGLMGLTLDPNYQSNKYIYAAYAYQKSVENSENSNKDYKVKVVRLTDNIENLADQKTVLDNIPGARYHVGGRLKFGPDGKLYLTTGENTKPGTAQDLSTLAGKILRMNSDGSVPEDNPFPNSLVYTLGHRNPQGIDWQPISGLMVQTEHGPSGYDGRRGGDEVNIIKKGNNYGWPTISYDQKKEGLQSPDIMYLDSVAPGSGSFYKSNIIPQFQNNYFFGALKGEGIYQVFFDETGYKILRNEKLEGINFGRVREVVEGLDGSLYFSTSNQDGNGKPNSDDDKIYRIAPDLPKLN